MLCFLFFIFVIIYYQRIQKAKYFVSANNDLHKLLCILFCIWELPMAELAYFYKKKKKTMRSKYVSDDFCILNSFSAKKTHAMFQIPILQWRLRKPWKEIHWVQDSHYKATFSKSLKHLCKGHFWCACLCVQKVMIVLQSQPTLFYVHHRKFCCIQTENLWITVR